MYYLYCAVTKKINVSSSARHDVHLRHIPPICYINFLPISRFSICSIYSSSYILPPLLSSVLSFSRFLLHSSMKRNNLRISSYTWKKRKLNEIKPRNATNTIHRANLFIYSENCSRTKRKRFIFFFFLFLFRLTFPLQRSAVIVTSYLKYTRENYNKSVFLHLLTSKKNYFNMK